MSGWSPELSRTHQNNNLNPECAERTWYHGTSRDRSCLSFSWKACGPGLSGTQCPHPQPRTGAQGEQVCALQQASPLYQTTPKDQHGATLLLMLYNNQKLKLSKCSWGQSIQNAPRRLRQGQLWLRAFKRGNGPAHAPLPSQLCCITDLRRQRSPCTAASTAHRPGEEGLVPATHRVERIAFHLKGFLAQADEEASPCQVRPAPSVSTPHLFNASSPPASGQEARSTGGRFHCHFPLRLPGRLFLDTAELVSLEIVKLYSNGHQ